MGTQTTAATVNREDNAQIAALMQQAGKAFQAGTFDRLAKLLDQVLEINPDHTGALYNRGILHRDANELYGAEMCFRRVLKLDPDMIDAYQALADLLFNVKHLLPAAKIYERALERAPNRLPLLHNFAKTHLMLKDAAQTEELARKILSIDERSVEALNDLAWALLYRKSGADEALQLTERALELSPNEPHTMVLREQALLAAGRGEEARSLWARILEACTTDWARTRPYCEAYNWLEQLDRARDIIMAYIAANPTRPEGLRDLGTLAMAEGDFAQAQEMMTRMSGKLRRNRLWTRGLTSMVTDFAKLRSSLNSSAYIT